MNNKAKIAISQIMILVIGIVAFSYALGGGIGFVGAEDNEKPKGPDVQTIATGLQISSTITPSTASQEGYPAAGIGGIFGAGEAQAYHDNLMADFQKKLDAFKKSDGAKVEDLGDGKYELTGGDDELRGAAKQAGADAMANKPGGFTNFLDGAISSIAYGATAYAASYALLAMFGADKKYLQSIPIALGTAVTAMRATHLLIEGGQLTSIGLHPSTTTAGAASSAGGWAVAGVGIVVFAVMFALNYEEEQFKVTTYNCNEWQAPLGGKDCHKCNTAKFPCGKYQCESLGQACQLLNDEATGDQLCVWVNPNDVTSPTVTVRSEALPTGYTYTNDTAISPPDAGVEIKYMGEGSDDDGCIPAFTPLTFGIRTIDREGTGWRDEPAICRVDTVRVGFDAMRFPFEHPEQYRINHTFTMSLPSIHALEEENLTLQNDGEFSVYVKCIDANGNKNMNDFVFKFCVQKGPDTQPPYVVGTSIMNGAPVAYGQENVNLTIYINEPAECRWSMQNLDYNLMTQNMSCSYEQSEFNLLPAWGCDVTLPGIKDRQENRFYFRCKDQPPGVVNVPDSDRNINSQDLFHEEGGFMILGTQPLVMDSVGPSNTTVRDSTELVKVLLTAKTSAGYREGLASCAYQEKGTQDLFVDFADTNSHQHSTTLHLPGGDYEYIIRCMDLGGNFNEKEISFKTVSDSEPPQITRFYKEENLLKIVTDEVAECVYDTSGSSYLFGDGIPMTTTNGINHFTEWSTRKKFFIKCQDEYGNQPAPDQSTIVIIPIE